MSEIDLKKGFRCPVYQIPGEGQLSGGGVSARFEEITLFNPSADEPFDGRIGVLVQGTVTIDSSLIAQAFHGAPEGTVEVTFDGENEVITYTLADGTTKVESY